MTPDAQRWLIEIKNDPKFKVVMREFRELRPIISKYAPQGTQEANTELLERIKYESGRQAGFDLIFLLLTGEKLDG